VTRTGGRRVAYRGVANQADGKNLLGTPGLKWVDINMDLQDITSGLKQDRSGSGRGQLAGCFDSGNETSEFHNLRRVT